MLIGAIIFALILTLQLNESYLFLYIIILSYWIGEISGWGEPLGSVLYSKPMLKEKLESWQIGILKTNAHLAMLVRGFMWGLPIGLVLFYFGYNTLAMITTISYIIFMLLSLVITKHTNIKDKWWFSEFLRGCLVMIQIQYYFLTIHI